MNKIKKYIDINAIVTGIVLFLLLAVASSGITGLFRLTSPTQEVNTVNAGNCIKNPKLTKESMEENKEKITTIEYDHIAIIIDERPVLTPPFVTDPRKLRNYLAQTSKTIKIEGQIEEAHLFIKSGKIDIEKESIYFYIVDNKIIEGHLYPPGALETEINDVFVYNLKALPIVKFPYSLKGEVFSKNVVDEVFNYMDSRASRKYYIGALVSTTNLPNQIERIEIRFSCQKDSFCDIRVLE